MFKFIGIVVLILAFMIYGPYINNHGYYLNFFWDKTNGSINISNWITVVGGLVSAFLPVIYMIIKNKFFTGNQTVRNFLQDVESSASKSSINSKVNLWVLILWFIIGYTIFFWIIGSQKGGYVGGGLIGLFNFYTLFLFFVILIIGFYAIGLWLIKLFFSDSILDKNNFLNFLLKLGFGTAIFSFLSFLLVIFDIINIYTALLLFFGLIAFIWYMRKELGGTKNWIEIALTEKIVNGELNLLYFFLLTLSILYIYFGFYYSFIPYPTAWDANHAYMYVPRMWAENGGYLWAEKSAWQPGNIWQGLLAWVYTLNGWTSFSRDTWMIETNFLSAIFTLFAGLGLIQEFIKFSFAYKSKGFSKIEENTEPINTSKFDVDKTKDNLKERRKNVNIKKTEGNNNKNRQKLIAILGTQIGIWFFIYSSIGLNKVGIIGALVLSPITYYIFIYLLSSVKKRNGINIFDIDKYKIKLQLLLVVYCIIIIILYSISKGGFPIWIYILLFLSSFLFSHFVFVLFKFVNKVKLSQSGKNHINTEPTNTSKFDVDKYVDIKGNYEDLDRALDERKEKEQDDKNTIIGKSVLFLLGFILLLTWLTSGMGAFLVFVDNKMDLAMLFFSILAIMSAIKMLASIEGGKMEKPEDKIKTGVVDTDIVIKKTNYLKKDYIIYAIFAGVFFAIANIIKPTANLDMMSMGMIIAILWFGGLALLAIVFVAIGVLSVGKIHNFQKILNSNLGLVSIVVGFVIGGFDAFKVWLVDKKKVIATIVFLVSFGLALLPVKGTMEIFKTANGASFHPVGSIKSILLGKNTVISQDNKTKHNLYCAGSCNLTMYRDLYSDLRKPPGEAYQEDNGRYVGYGGYKFKNPWWGFFVSDKKDLGKYNDLTIAIAKVIEQDLDWFNSYSGDVQSILNTIKTIEEYKTLSGANYKDFFAYDLNKMKEELHGNKIFSMYEKNENGGKNKIVNVPYKYLIPFNVTFNWSLQNTSSYYTDIGVNRLILFVLILIGLIYSLFKRDKSLLSFTLSTIIYWIIWYFIASGIVWYGIGGIIYLILSTLFLLQRTYKVSESNNIFMWILFLVFALALPLNFFRISTYGGVGPFTYYRGGEGKNAYIPDKKIIPYSSKYIFDLSFGHYSQLIDAVNNRQKGEKLIISGTYARYFFSNQTLIQGDQFVNKLWKWFSDGNICKSYLRLKDNGIKHIVIDPNLGTVTKSKVGANAQLRNRYFAKQNPKNREIEDPGVMVRLVDLAQEGYLQLRYTNNIAIRYAFILTDDEIKKVTGFTTAEQIKNFRYKLTVLRYGYIADFEEVYLNLINLMYQRILTGEILEDLNYMYKYNISKEDLQGYLWMLINKRQLLQEQWKELPGPVMHVLSQYNIWLNYIKSGKKDLMTENLIKAVRTNVNASSQILWLEVK